ncbi:MAG: hypothetical protein HGA82_03020 [Anaerolineales bacterium]|nr:hypothetical protein [Anaerolineales bacterium]
MVELPIDRVAQQTAVIWRRCKSLLSQLKPAFSNWLGPNGEASHSVNRYALHLVVIMMSFGIVMVSRVRLLPAGAGVSYGRTYLTSRPTLAALVPVGYGDGFHRILSNKGSVLIRGRRAPILGRVCMDQFVVDVSGIPEVLQDDEVVLIGQQGQAHIRAEEVALLAGTINYEVTTSLLPRVARLYYTSDQLVRIDSIAGE